MARQAFYETLVGMVETLRQMGEEFEEARSKLPRKPPTKVNKDLNNLADCIHKGRTAIIRGITTTLAKPTVRQYLGVGVAPIESVEALTAEVARLRLILRENEVVEPTEAAQEAEAAGDSDAVVPEMLNYW